MILFVAFIVTWGCERNF